MSCAACSTCISLSFRYRCDDDVLPEVALKSRKSRDKNSWSFPIGWGQGLDKRASGASGDTRGRKHPHFARSGRTGGTSGAAVLNRQGQLGTAAPGAQGVLSRQATVPAAAY